jgi:hypothetical protein
MRRFVLVLAVLALAGCGGSEKAATGPETTTGPTVAQGDHDVRVYFLQGGRVAAAARVVRGPDVGAAALDALEQGPSEKERLAALTSDVSGLGELSIDNTAATVAGLERLPRLGKAQVVYTLTQFPSVQTVNGFDRADFEDETPAILVESPSFGATVRSPIRVTGTANTFEATFQYELKDDGGTVLAKHFVTATSGNGQRGTFAFNVPYDGGNAGPGTLVVYEISAADGSRIHTREIPLNLAP